MKVYLAGETALAKEEGWTDKVEGWTIGAMQRVIKRRLYSYFYHDRIDKEVQLAIDSGMDLFLDSGAYSAFTQNKEIKLDDYARFINAHGHHFTVMANLDVIGDTGPLSWANFEELRRQGCDVFPVFHFEDDPKYLVRMLDMGIPFMALGGLVGAGRSVLRDWLDDIWDKYLVDAEGKPRTNVHGFGLTDTELMLRYPWFSVDSSSWVMTSIFGGCLFRDGSKFFKVTFSDESPDKRDLNSWHYDRLTPDQQARVREWLAYHGVTAEQLASHYSWRHIVNARTFQEVELMATPATFRKPQIALFS